MFLVLHFEGDQKRPKIRVVLEEGDERPTSILDVQSYLFRAGRDLPKFATIPIDELRGDDDAKRKKDVG